MTRTKFLFWLPAGAVVLGLSCAPTDDPPARELLSSPAAVRERSDGPASTPVPPGGLKERIEAALENIHQRDVLTTHSFWTVFHCILGTGPDATLLDSMTNRRVNAIEYIRNGGEVRGLEFIPTPDGLDVRTGPQFVGQGHQDQFVAEMAQWGMPANTRFLVRGKEYTYADFVHHTQARARVTSNQELSWAIVVIGQYVGTDVSWTNAAGEKLRFEDLVRYELDQPIDGAACGGTHRLFGLTWAYHLHLRHGGQTVGVWKDVADKTARYQRLAHTLQNPDGSFSTKYLSGPGNARDGQLRIGTTGHVLEWLALSLPDSELRAPWVQEAASALALMILDNQSLPVEGGALYHAAHGLHIYHDRVFGPNSSGRREPMIPLPPEPVAKPTPGAAPKP
jgi:hypothetical protein